MYLLGWSSYRDIRFGPVATPLTHGVLNLFSLAAAGLSSSVSHVVGYITVSMMMYHISCFEGVDSFFTIIFILSGGILHE